MSTEKQIIRCFNMKNSFLDFMGSLTKSYIVVPTHMTFPVFLLVCVKNKAA